MFLDASGNWTCPDDADGRDIRTLDEGNAMHARSRRGPMARGDGVLIDGAYDRIFDETFDESFG